MDAPEVAGDEELLEVVKHHRLHASIEEAAKKAQALVNGTEKSEVARTRCKEFLKSVSLLKGD